MKMRRNNVAKRLLLALSASAAVLGLTGCVAYGPPYASAYDPAPVVAAPYYSPYYSPYAYGRPAYVGPPLSLNFGYYEHRYRGGGPGYRGYHGGHDVHGHRGWRGGGPGWRGPGWSGGPRWSGPRSGGGGRGAPGGYRGGGGGRGHR